MSNIKSKYNKELLENLFNDAMNLDSKHIRFKRDNFKKVFYQKRKKLAEYLLTNSILSLRGYKVDDNGVIQNTKLSLTITMTSNKIFFDRDGCSGKVYEFNNEHKFYSYERLLGNFIDSYEWYLSYPGLADHTKANTTWKYKVA